MVRRYLGELTPDQLIAELERAECRRETAEHDAMLIQAEMARRAEAQPALFG